MFDFFSDAADKVVNGEGKFEQLIVSSREIAASTAQLVSLSLISLFLSFSSLWYMYLLQVAASKVKAHSKSEKLKALKASSRTGEINKQIM